jgi:hypothetical protein
MYVQRYIVAWSRNHCCLGITTARSSVIVVGVNTAVRDVKVSSVDGEEQQWVPFAAVVELHNISYCW